MDKPMIIGCQFSIYPMTENFVEVITGAISGLKEAKNLDIESDDISTMLRGEAGEVFTAVADCFLKASAVAGHVVLSVTFSHGCPGEPGEACCIPAGPSRHIHAPKSSAKIRPSGVPVAAQFALYPMGDADCMPVIYREIEAAKKIVNVTPKHFCTRLDGDAAAVFRVLQDALVATTTAASHVVVTATVSKH